MAEIKPYDTAYEIPEIPIYDPIIRAIKNSDPVNAETIVNPLIKQIITNVHAVKLSDDGKAQIPVVSNVNLIASNWIGSTAPYTQQVSVDGIVKTDNTESLIYVVPVNTTDNVNAISDCNITAAEISSNKIKFSANKKPSASVSFIIINAGSVNGTGIVNIPAGSTTADTVDGKHAADFAPSGFGLGGASQFVSGDWNDYIKTGFYYGSDMLNQPPTTTGTNNTWFVMSIKFGDDRWCTQVSFNSQSINLNYIRKKTNGTWSQWQQLNSGGIADTIKNTLPINKGGTGATDVINALKNLNLLNYNFNNPPSCSPLVYKTYADFGIASISIHNFIRALPEHSFVIFENSKSTNVYITDAPYSIGIIYAFKGYVHDGQALFFSGQGDNGNIYHFSCNREVILKNWTKINDGGNADTIDGKHAVDLQNYNNLTNKPTGLPADGGNADTVDGKHATDFATTTQVTSINNSLNNKVDKVSGQGLSTNDFTAVYKSKLDGIATGAEQNVQSDWNTTDINSDTFIKNKPTSIPADGGNADTVDEKHADDFVQTYKIIYSPVADDMKTKGEYFIYEGTGFPDSGSYGWLKVVEGVDYLSRKLVKQTFTCHPSPIEPIESTYLWQRSFNKTWTEWTKVGDSGDAHTVDGKHATDFATVAQITTMNNSLDTKVDKVSGQGLSTNDFTVAYKSKLEGVATGAEQNVQSDWNTTDVDSDAFIKNKPDISALAKKAEAPAGFNVIYKSTVLESNSWYRIATTERYTGTGIFTMEMTHQSRQIFENYITFAVATPVTHSLLTANPVISIQANAYYKPMITKIRMTTDLAEYCRFIEFYTNDLLNVSPLSTNIYLNFSGFGYTSFNKVNKVSESDNYTLLEVNL